MDILKTDVRTIALKELKNNTGQIEGVPANPRVLRDDAYKALVASLQADNLTGVLPLKVIQYNGEWVVLGGNMRLRALKEIGAKDVECIVVPQDTDADTLRKIVITDNSTFGEWDNDMLANEWNAKELREWGVDIEDFEKEEEPEVREDNFDENEDEVQTVCQPGNLWQLGEHRILCGDSTKTEDLQRLMQGEQADLWITDPPYNVDVRNSQGMTIKNDNMESSKFGEFLYAAFKAAKTVLSKGAPFYIWFASSEHINFETALNKVGLKVRQELIWNKDAFILGRSHYQWKHEPCLYGWNSETCRYFIDRRNLSSVIQYEEELNIDKMTKGEMKSLLHKIFEEKVPVTIINEPKPIKDEDHPTMKPIRLFGYQIRNSSKPGDIVLDTFGGSGTTIVACEQLHRMARIIELDPHYCDVIIARWEKFTGNKATLINNN